MPEGHIIHRLARELTTTLGDEPVVVTSPQGRFADGAALIDGSRLERAEAFGKYLFLHWSPAQTLHIHLGLIGKLRRVPDTTPERDSIRVRLRVPGVVWDLTGPTRCQILGPDEVQAITSRLGPDPLRPRPDVAAFHQRLSTTAAPVGSALLDQRIIAGLGNIFRAEVLFRSGIDPRRPSVDLSAAEVDDIWANSVGLMRIGRRLGRIVTTEPAEIGRARSRIGPDDALYVYHREHCRRCGSAIRTVRLAGRPIQFCPTCQAR